MTDPRPKMGLGRLRYALGDGATEEQARGIWQQLNALGLLHGAGQLDPRRIIGLAEVAEIMNRTVQAVRAWRDLPEPVVRLKSGPIFDRIEIEAFRDARPELCGVRAAEDG